MAYRNSVAFLSNVTIADSVQLFPNKITHLQIYPDVVARTFDKFCCDKFVTTG